MTQTIDGMGAKQFSVVMAFACLRYALGGKHDRYSIDDCIRWLTFVRDHRPTRAALEE